MAAGTVSRPLPRRSSSRSPRSLHRAAGKAASWAPWFTTATLATAGAKSTRTAALRPSSSRSSSSVVMVSLPGCCSCCCFSSACCCPGCCCASCSRCLRRRWRSTNATVRVPAAAAAAAAATATAFLSTSPRRGSLGNAGSDGSSIRPCKGELRHRRVWQGAPQLHSGLNLKTLSYGMVGQKRWKKNCQPPFEQLGSLPANPRRLHRLSRLLVREMDEDTGMRVPRPAELRFRSVSGQSGRSRLPRRCWRSASSPPCRQTACSKSRVESLARFECADGPTVPCHHGLHPVEERHPAPAAAPPGRAPPPTLSFHTTNLKVKAFWHRISRGTVQLAGDA